MITNFPTNPAINVSGIFNFQFIPYHLLSGLPAISGKTISDPIQPAPGKSLLLGYSTLGELEFEEAGKSDSNGPYYQWKIEGFVPGDSPALITLMEDMELMRHLVIIRDSMNLQRLVGYGAPLDFSAVFQSGKKPGEARGYRFTFSGTSASRAPIYTLG